jgi:hypothetical protein
MPRTLCVTKGLRDYLRLRMARRLSAFSFQLSALSLCCLLLVTACNSTSELPTSVWGQIHTLAQAEQSNAPALYLTSRGEVTSVWVNADETGVHQDMRQGTAETIVLPLPPVHPYAQTLNPSLFDGDMHLLWLDADYEQRDDVLIANTTYLFGAFITSARVERGPTRITNMQTFHYAAVPHADGGLWTAWSGGLASEPELYAQRIDNNGRPLQSRRIALNADFPVLARADDGTLFLFWTQPSSGSVYLAGLDENGAHDMRVITHTPILNAGDRVVNISAGMDRTHLYLLWNIDRADGHAETWWTSGAFDAASWGVPQRLGISPSTEAFVTDFNGGAGVTVTTGETWLSWSAPLVVQYEMLSLAVWDGTQLGVVYLQSGAVVGYQAVVAVDLLIGIPALMTDRDRHLYLSWSHPTPEGYADLLLTTTRR